MNNQCISCEQTVPHHFQNKGITQCLTCTAVKVSFAGQIKPDTKEREKDPACILCNQSIPIGLPRSALCEDCLHVIETNTGHTYFHLYKNSSQPWLIKSGGLVLGPLSSTQVEEKIRNKEIGLFDLVQKPYGRWLYAREEETFKDVVEEVRNRPSGREDTVALSASEITEVADMNRLGEGTNGMRTVHPLAEGDDPTLPLQHYSTDNPPATTFRTFIFFGFLLFLGTAIVTILSLSGVGGSLSPEEYRKLIQQGQNAYNAGDFNAARMSFRQANVSKELNDTGIALTYASILVGQDLLAEADIVLNKVSALPLDIKNKANTFILKGNKSLASGDLKGAEEFYKTALESDRGSELAIFNMGNLYLLMGDFDRSIDTLQTIENPQEGRELWNFVLLSALASKVRTKGSAEESKEILNRNLTLEATRPYTIESRVLLTYLDLKQGDQQAAAREIDYILLAEPDITDNAVPNLWLYRKQNPWQTLEVYCNEIKDLLSDGKLGMLLLSYCYARAGEPAKAKDLAQEIFLKNESDSLARSVLAFAQFKVGKNDQTESLLKDRELKSHFEFWLLAKSCEALKNTDCLMSAVERLLELNSGSAFGIAHKIRYYIENKNKSELNKWIEIGRDRAWYDQNIRQLELSTRIL